MYGMIFNMPPVIDLEQRKPCSADTQLHILMVILGFMLRFIFEAPRTQRTKVTILVFFIVMNDRI
jgi:uncharacterized membrane protein YqaE (UPF0057 family)